MNFLSKTMADGSSSAAAEPIGQHLIKLISNVCFSVFVMLVLIFTVIAITYQPPDPWLESSKAITREFTRIENATFHPDDSLVKTGEDLNVVTLAPSPQPETIETLDKEIKNSTNSSCPEENSPVNCSDSRVLVAIKRYNLKAFARITFFEYQKPVNGSKGNECDVSWKFRPKKEKSWRKYRDFRRFRLKIADDCTKYEVIWTGKWHSGVNARPVSIKKDPQPQWRKGSTFINRHPYRSSTPPASNSSIFVVDSGINDTIPELPSLSAFRKGKYLYYSRGGDYCKRMDQYMWSFLCALGEASYLNRTLVMDMSICLNSIYRDGPSDEEGKDFRFYFDLEHLEQSASVTEEGQFVSDWKTWDRTHVKDKVPVRKVVMYKVPPMQLKKEKSTIIWRQFDAPEPENYWYRVCEGEAAKYVQRPWQALWKSKRLMNIVSAISGRLDWDFDAVHVVRGAKAENTKLWPNLDKDTSPSAVLEKVKQKIKPGRKVFIATNEPFYNYFDKLRSDYKVFLLDDFKELWGVNSEWYNETRLLNHGEPVPFDGYMRVEVDTEVLYRSKTRVETFNDLTSDCKDGINTC